jgi:hypothetical protein
MFFDIVEASRAAEEVGVSEPIFCMLASRFSLVPFCKIDGKIFYTRDAIDFVQTKGETNVYRDADKKD